MQKPGKRNWIIFFVIALCILVLDITTKEIVESNIPYLSEIRITSFFNIVHVRNRGSLFGLFSDVENQSFRIIFNVVSVSAMVFLFIFSRYFGGISFYIIGAMLGGATGNVSERILKGYVVDFLDFHIGNWHWPAFNIADTTITVGMIAIIIHSFITKEKERKKKKDLEVKVEK